ncbi:MAG: TM2 domain-containing protein [Planctomycetes bacterium]|nr:TM2 domain-containing protein [Planctomycetota bacterium]
MEAIPIPPARTELPHKPYHADACNDPLVGTQEHPDQLVEVMLEPESEAAEWPTSGTPEKSHILAGVLGILFGVAGVHRFYLAYFKVAFFQLALFVIVFGAVTAYGVATAMPMTSTLIIATFASALFWLWGAVEGAMILAGLMPHDGHGHPLR